LLKAFCLRCRTSLMGMTSIQGTTAKRGSWRSLPIFGAMCRVITRMRNRENLLSLEAGTEEKGTEAGSGIGIAPRVGMTTTLTGRFQLAERESTRRAENGSHSRRAETETERRDARIGSTLPGPKNVGLAEIGGTGTMTPVVAKGSVVCVRILQVRAPRGAPCLLWVSNNVFVLWHSRAGHMHERRRL